MKSSPLQHVMEVIGLTVVVLFIVFVSNNPLSTKPSTQPAAAAISGITSTGALSSACDSLYNLPSGTVTSSSGSTYLNPQVCAAYQYLISIYNPGPASQVGLTNAKVTGITSLNEKFAIALANMLQAANAKGYHITIASAYRTQAGEAKANPVAAASGFVSMHTLGLAADLIFPEVAGTSNTFCGLSKGTSPSTPSYNFVLQNEASYGLGSYNVLHNPVKGECNHVEWAGKPPGGIGPGTGAGLTASQAAGPNTVAPTSATNAPTAGSLTGAAADLEDDTSWSTGETCPSGQECYTCTGNQCLTVPSASGNAQTTDSTTGTNAAGAAANTTSGQCSLGLINIGGSCLPMSMLQSLLSPQQAAAVPPPPPAPATTPTTASNPPTPASETAALSSAPSLSSVASTPTTQSPLSSNLLQTTPSTSIVPATPITIPTITIPTLLTPTSTQSLLQQLENPPTLNIPASATVTPITLNNTSVVSELAPSNPPPTLQPSIEPLAQAQPSPSGQPSAQQGAPAQNGANLGAITVEQPSTQVTQSQPGGTTFESGNLGGSAPQTLAPAQNTFASDALSILQTLQGELIKALQFLKPFNSGSTQ